MVGSVCPQYLTTVTWMVRSACQLSFKRHFMLTITVMLDVVRSATRSATRSINQVLVGAIRKRVQAGSVIYADDAPALQVCICYTVAGVCTMVFIHLMLGSSRHRRIPLLQTRRVAALLYSIGSGLPVSRCKGFSK